MGLHYSVKYCIILCLGPQYLLGPDVENTHVEMLDL